MRGRKEEDDEERIWGGRGKGDEPVDIEREIVRSQ